MIPGQTSPVTLVGLAAKPSDLTTIIKAKDGCGANDCAEARADAREQVDRLFLRTEAAARKGDVDFITWSEAAAPLFVEDVAAFDARARSLSQQYQLYLAPAVFIIEPGRTPWRNEVYLFNPAGRRIAAHLKSKPVPGEISVDGPDRLSLQAVRGFEVCEVRGRLRRPRKSSIIWLPRYPCHGLRGRTCPMFLPGLHNKPFCHLRPFYSSTPSLVREVLLQRLCLTK